MRLLAKLGDTERKLISNYLDFDKDWDCEVEGKVRDGIVTVFCIDPSYVIAVRVSVRGEVLTDFRLDSKNVSLSGENLVTEINELFNCELPSIKSGVISYSVPKKELEKMCRYAMKLGAEVFFGLRGFGIYGCGDVEGVVFFWRSTTAFIGSASLYNPKYVWTVLKLLKGDWVSVGFLAGGVPRPLYLRSFVPGGVIEGFVAPTTDEFHGGPVKVSKAERVVLLSALQVELLRDVMEFASVVGCEVYITSYGYLTVDPYWRTGLVIATRVRGLKDEDVVAFSYGAVDRFEGFVRLLSGKGAKLVLGDVPLFIGSHGMVRFHYYSPVFTHAPQGVDRSALMVLRSFATKGILEGMAMIPPHYSTLKEIKKKLMHAEEIGIKHLGKTTYPVVRINGEEKPLVKIRLPRTEGKVTWFRMPSKLRRAVSIWGRVVSRLGLGDEVEVRVNESLFIFRVGSVLFSFGL